MMILFTIPLLVMVVSLILSNRRQNALADYRRNHQGSITVSRDRIVVISGQNIYRLPCLVYYW
jgi:hypothetical protein